MRSLIIFSFLIAVTCAASLGHQDGSKVTTLTTTEASVKPVQQKLKTLHHSGDHVSASGKLEKINEIEGIHKLEEAIEIEEEKSTDAFHVGARTLEAFSKVLNSDELKQAGEKSTSDHTKKSEAVLETSKPEATKTENGNTTKSSIEEKKEHVSTGANVHASNHVHSRQTDKFFGAGSQIIQNGGLLGVENGAINFGNGGIVSSDRLISTGGLINNGGVLRTGGLINNGDIVRTGSLVNNGGLVYNQGLSGNSGLVNTVLNTGRIIESGQLVNAGGIIGSGQINSGGLIRTGEVIGSGIQGANNNILVNNYGSGIVGNNGGILRNSAEGTKTLVVGLDALDSVPQTVEYSKQYFHFEAPEERHEEGQITKQLSNVLKKNLQVVFINAPENTVSTNAALQLAKQAIEQRTAIYVLSKEAEAAQLVGQLQQIQENVQTTPEVRIIKYRTPEDLERAKLDIQTQYEATGGSSESFNGGVAPLLNYASPGQNIREIGTLLGPGLISSTNVGNGNHAQSSNVISAVADSEHFGGGQNVALGKEALLGSSVGQLNIIRSSNIGSSGLLGSGSSNVYNTNIGPSSQLGSGSVLGSNSGSSVGQLNIIRSSNTGASGLLGSGSSNVYTSNIGASRQLGSGAVLGSNSGSSVGQLNIIRNSNTGASGLLGTGSSNVYNSNIGPSSQLGSGAVLGSNSGSSVGQLNVIRSSNGASGLLGSGSSKVYNSNIGSSSQLGIGSVLGSNSGSSKFFVAGPLVGSSTGSTGSIGGASLQGSKIITSNPIASGNLVGSNSGSSKLLGTGTLVGSSIGSSGSGLQAPTIGLVRSGSQVGSGTLNPVGSVSTNSLGINSVSGNTGFARELGSNSIVSPTSGSKFLVGSDGASKTSGSSLAGSSPLLESYTSGNSDGFGSSSLQATNGKSASGSNVGLSSGPQVIAGGPQLSSSNGSPKVSGSQVASGIASSKQTVAGSSLGSGFGSSSNIQSGSLSGLNSGSSKVVGGGSSNSGTGSSLGSNQGSLKLTGGNFAAGSGSVVGSTTISPKSTRTIIPLGAVAYNTGSSNVIGNGLLTGSSSGSKVSGSSSSLGSGVGPSKVVGSGSLSGINAGSYASDLTVGSSKQSGSGFSSGTGSSKQIQNGKLASGTGSTQSSGSESSKISDNVSVLGSTRVDHGQDGSNVSGSQHQASGSGILLGSTVGSGGKYVSGLGIGSTIGEIVKVNN